MAAGAARSLREQERDELELARVAEMERAKRQALLARLSGR